MGSPRIAGDRILSAARLIRIEKKETAAAPFPLAVDGVNGKSQQVNKSTSQHASM